MLLQSDIYDAKPWRLRALATQKRKALRYASDLDNRVPSRQDTIETLERDLGKIAAELARQKGAPA